MKTLILGLFISLFSVSSLAIAHNSADTQPSLLSLAHHEAQFASSVSKAINNSTGLKLKLTYELILEATNRLSKRNQQLVDNFQDEFFDSQHAIALDQNMTDLLKADGALTNAIIDEILEYAGYTPDDGIEVACIDERNPFCR